MEEICLSKVRFGLPERVPVMSWYEAWSVFWLLVRSCSYLVWATCCVSGFPI